MIEQCVQVTPGTGSGSFNPGDCKYVTLGTGSGRVSPWKMWMCDHRYRVGRWDHPSDCRHVTVAQGLGRSHPGACGHATQVQGLEGFTVETMDM